MRHHQNISLDLDEVRDALGADSGGASVEALRTAAAVFRGELLEGLDLLDAFRFHAWCAAERESARALRMRVLSAIITRVSDPEEALIHARHLVAIDPLNEDANTRVIRLLVEMGRHPDAESQWQAFRRVLTLELGEVPKDVAKRVRRLVHEVPAKRERGAPAVARTSAAPTVPFAGRDRELAELQDWISDPGTRATVAIISGEPGQGKTRLCDELAQIAHRSGHRVIGARAYRAEIIRAFGPFRDALSALPGTAEVLGTIGAQVTDVGRRVQLFEDLLAALAAPVVDGNPLLITLDDLQWLDAASAAFMHFVARTAEPQQVRLVATLRPGELMDNSTVEQILESLRGDSKVLEMGLGPLPRDAVQRICGAIADRIDVAEVVARSEGNALVAVETARVLARGESELPANIHHLLESQLRTLGDGARELLSWAAALGRTFHVDVLERVLGMSPSEMVDRIGELEARGVLVPKKNSAYDFSHDLVREAAYRALSGPRRRMVHRAIARAFDAAPKATDAAELLRHAELGGEAYMACHASAVAARDALAMGAWNDACLVADRGLEHVGGLPPEERDDDVVMSLLQTRVDATSILGRRHPDHLVSRIEELLTRAESPRHKFASLHLLYVVGLDHGHDDRAEAETLRAADVSRKADAETAARQMAHAARCFLHLEREVGEARGLLRDTEHAVEVMGLREVELHWGRALLARWDGDLNGAVMELESAIAIARDGGDRWREASCTTTLIKLCLEAGDFDRAYALGQGGATGGGGQNDAPRSPFVDAMTALAALRRGKNTMREIESALETLRARDARVQSSFVLAELARFHLEHAALEAAERDAQEAIDHATAARRTVIAVDALCTIAETHVRRGDKKRGRSALGRARALAAGDDVLTQRVRDRLDALLTHAQKHPHSR